jgi:predicted esterase
MVAAVMILPEDWRTRPWVPLLIVCSPSGLPAIPQALGYTNAALAEGWAVLAADGPRLAPDQDTVMWNWGAVESALAQWHRVLPRARTWPLAVGGFSGGAKRATYVAAAALEAGFPVTGVFMGGCNEDRATIAARLFRAGPQFRSVRMYLSNGERDPIANPTHGGAVKSAMESSGFTRVRLERYPAAHVLHPPQVREALRWFGEATVSPKRASP